MKIIVDRLPENPKDCIFSRATTGTRRCVHNSHICALARGNECPHLTAITDQTVEFSDEHIFALMRARFPGCNLNMEEAETTESAPEQSKPEKRTTKKAAKKKDDASE